MSPVVAPRPSVGQDRRSRRRTVSTTRPRATPLREVDPTHDPPDAHQPSRLVDTAPTTLMSAAGLLALMGHHLLPDLHDQTNRTGGERTPRPDHRNTCPPKRRRSTTAPVHRPAGHHEHAGDPRSRPRSALHRDTAREADHVVVRARAGEQPQRQTGVPFRLHIGPTQRIRAVHIHHYGENSCDQPLPQGPRG